MWRLVTAQTLRDEALPIEVGELPADLAALDELLPGPGLLEAFSSIASARRSCRACRLPIMGAQRWRSRRMCG